MEGSIMVVWSVAFNIAYKNGTSKCVEVVQDNRGLRLSLGTMSDWHIAKRLPKFSEFTAAYGFGYVASLPSNIAAYNFRFTAITTNGHINVLGSDEKLSPGSVNNDVAIAAELIADSGFASYLVPSAMVMINTDYVDYDPNNADAEASNVIATLSEYGVDTRTFTDISANGFRAALADTTVLIIPENENDTLVLSEEANAVIRDYVDGGGTFLFMETSLDYVNQIFSWSIATNEGTVLPFDKSESAAAYGFGGCPSQIDGNLNGNSPLDISSLPTGAVPIYTFEDMAAVVVFPRGQGKVIYIAWDWYDAAPIGEQDGGWLEVLVAAVTN